MQRKSKIFKVLKTTFSNKKILIGILILLALAFSVSAHPYLYIDNAYEVDEGDTLSFQINSTFPDNGSSTFDFSPSLSWIDLNQINNTAATITLSPTYNDDGTYLVEFSVSDDNSTYPRNVNITVNNVNRAPTINLPASETLVEGFAETVAFTASDPDIDDTLEYSVITENTSEVDCGVTGTSLTMTPATGFTGTSACTVQVSDGDLTANDTISLTVQAQNPSFSVGSVDFGNVELNTTTTTKPFTITNNGNMDLNNIGVLVDSAYDKYKVNITSVTQTLLTGASDTAQVNIYIPSDANTGSLTIPVTLTSNEVNQIFNLNADILGRLRITDLDVKVDDKSDNNLQDKEDGYKIGEKAKPQSLVKFTVEVENNFPDDGPDIENIVVTITILDIDDGEDLEKESEEFDLKPGKNNDVNLEFDIPLKVDEEDYEVTIEVEGEDEDGNEHKVTKTLTLEVDKDSHDLKIRRASISPESVDCSRSVELEVGVVNIGSREEDEVVINVKSSVLGIDLNERNIELSEDPDDDDNEWEGTFSFDIGDNVRAGTYTIEVRAYYDEDKLEDLQRVNLEVRDCVRVTQPTEEEEEEIEVITPEGEEEEVITPPAEEEKKFTETTEYILMLVLANLIIVIIVVGLLIALLRK